MISKFDPFFEPKIFRNISPIFPQFVVMEYGFDVSEPDQFSPSPVPLLLFTIEKSKYLRKQKIILKKRPQFV